MLYDVITQTGRQSERGQQNSKIKKPTNYTTTKWLIMTWKWNMETNNSHTQLLCCDFNRSISSKIAHVGFYSVLDNYYDISCDIIVFCVSGIHFCRSIQLWIYTCTINMCIVQSRFHPKWLRWFLFFRKFLLFPRINVLNHKAFRHAHHHANEITNYKIIFMISFMRDFDGD